MQWDTKLDNNFASFLPEIIVILTKLHILHDEIIFTKLIVQRIELLKYIFNSKVIII